MATIEESGTPQNTDETQKIDTGASIMLDVGADASSENAVSTDAQSVELIAGGGNPKSAIIVGSVYYWQDCENIYIKYVIEDQTPENLFDDWFITQTHLQISQSMEGIPQTKGNPIPGKFDYQMSHDYVAGYTYTVPITWEQKTTLYIAAHAVVETKCGLDSLEYALPDTVNVKVKYPVSGGIAYFPEVTISSDTFIDGAYPGWCIDTDHTIGQNTLYTANVYSSYETLPSGIIGTGFIEKPENLDLINYILNQKYVGKTSPGGFGTYTYGDVQRAIWQLIDDQQSTSGLGSWNQDRVNEILDAASTYGEGYTPGCNDIVAIIMVPYSGNTLQQIIIAQIIMAEVGVPCDCMSETAWGNGQAFPGKNWATYFTYTVETCDNG